MKPHYTNTANPIDFPSSTMNERIQELIEQATTRQVVSGSDVFTTPPVYFNKEKFAELLIRECVERIQTVGVLEHMASTGDMFADAVLEHFGVE
jgi:FKBP-type peptidyl-prolyl cis-trans isomerase (trigger factor)